MSLSGIFLINDLYGNVFVCIVTSICLPTDRKNLGEGGINQHI